MSLFKNFNKYKNNIAIIDENKKILTFKNILIESKKINKYLKNKNLILLISENSIGSLLAYIFCILKNQTAIIIDAKTSKDSIVNIIKVYKPKFVFCSAENSYFLKNKFEIRYEFFKHYLFENKKNSLIKINNNLSLLLSTSGSMGGLKFVKLSKKNLKSNSNSILKYLKINQSDAAITNLPISYSYMISIINTHLEVGGKILVTKYSIVQKQFWETYYANKITSFNGVPYSYEILKKIGIKYLKSDHLKYLTQAGGKLDKKTLIDIVNFSNKNKIDFFSMYGQTEASPRISFLDPKLSQKKIGSIGKAIPGNKIYLIDKSNKKILKPNKIGELVCEGDNIFMGYSNNYLDLKKNKIKSKKLKTGDLAYFDKDNFFYIVGRKNKLAKIFGNRIDLDFLEDQLMQKGFKAICISDNKKIYLFSEKKYKKKKFLLAAERILNVNIRYLEIIKVKSFPRTTNNKISYKKLQMLIDARL